MESNKRLFFQRQRDQRGDWSTTFSIDHFPEKTRKQCWMKFATSGYTGEISKDILTSLAQEMGSVELFPVIQDVFENKLYNFFISVLQDKNNRDNREYAFTVLEMMCQAMQQYADNYGVPDDLYARIQEINRYLREGGVGYQYQSGQLMPLDDENVASDFIQPAISILNQPVFEGSYDYIQNAFQQYRSGDLEEALDNTMKGCEALLKCIFEKKEIGYGKETYMPLLEKARQEGLFPAISGDKLSPLIHELKALGELRNKGSGHGQVSPSIQTRHVRLAIHHALANMMFIAECFLEQK